MPNIGVYHPQIVHFVIGLLIVGVTLRVLSLLRKWPWMSPAASTLVLVGTLAAVAAAQSGRDAHGPVEQIPGAREAVQEHEDAGMAARNVFLGVAVIELLALGLAKRGYARWIQVAAAAAGVVGVGFLYEAGEHGGTLVYSYAGGVGIRSGDPADVGHLLTAGLYNQALLDRKAGHGADAGRLIDELVRRSPDDAMVKLAGIESQITDKKDPQGALAALAQLPKAGDNRQLQFRVALLRSDAWLGAGNKDSARQILNDLKAKDPRASRFVDERLSAIK